MRLQGKPGIFSAIGNCGTPRLALAPCTEPLEMGDGHSRWPPALGLAGSWEDPARLEGSSQGRNQRCRFQEPCPASPQLLPHRRGPHLGHDHVLALLDVLALGLDDGVQEVEVLDVAAVGGHAVDEVLRHRLVDLGAQLVVVEEDVLHRLRLQQLGTRGRVRSGGCRNCPHLLPCLVSPPGFPIPCSQPQERCQIPSLCCCLQPPLGALSLPPGSGTG